MIEYIIVVLLSIGVLFILLAAVGMVKMPDTFTRMHATTKAATMGASLMLVAVAVYFRDFGIASLTIAIIFFLFLTAPITAHMIGRAAYFIGGCLWKGTSIDDLRQEQKAPPTCEEKDGEEK